jgi:predicted MFS family arabinose efflux permease
MILFIVATENFYIGLPNSGFTPLEKCLTKFYGISTTVVVLTSFFYLLGIIMVSFIFNYLCQRFSLKYLNFICLIILLCGSVVRLLSELSFWLILVGQFIVGLGAGIIINVQIAVSFYWFSENTRGIALAIISIFCLLGKYY